MKNKVINLFGNTKIEQNTGVKYSKLLEQFIEPFASEFEDVEYVEDILEFAINAWNFANMKEILPKDESENIANYIDEDVEINIKLLNNMIDYKTLNFKEYNNFIVDFELKEVQAGKDPILTVLTQEKEVYLATMMDAIEDEEVHAQENYEENFINRSAIILKVKQPFFDWYAALYPEDDLQQELQKSNIYLVDETINDLEKWLKKKFDDFFKMELNDWHTNQKEWPQNRTYKMFTLWFQVELSEDIYDLVKKPVLKSE